MIIEIIVSKLLQEKLRATDQSKLLTSTTNRGIPLCTYYSIHGYFFLLNLKGVYSMATKSEKKLPSGITLRKDGTYMGRFYYHGERNYVYGKNLKEVVKKLEDLRYEMKHGMYAKAQNLSLDSWFDLWMKDYKKNILKVGTYEIYRNQYDYYIRSKLGKKMLVDIRPEHINRLYNDLVEKDFATGSIKLVSAMLNGCFKQAERNGIISKNPVPLVNIPKGKARKERVVFTPEQQELFIGYSEQSYLHDFFLLALMTGMRNGELRGLRWSDIDFKKKIIHVNHTLVYTKEKGYFLDTPKTKTSKRDIPMLGQCYNLLKRMQANYNDSKVVSINKEDLIFTVCDGKELSRDRVTLELNKITKLMQADNIEIEHITCHCLRHTFATRAIEQGMQPQVLKTIMGHSSLAMTMDLYSHVLPNTKNEEMQKLASIF